MLNKSIFTYLLKVTHTHKETYTHDRFRSGALTLHIHTHIHTYIHTYIHKYIHTYSSLLENADVEL